CGSGSSFPTITLGGAREGAASVSEQVMGKFIDMTGMSFGRLTVRARHRTRCRGPHALWHCDCYCGTECVVSGSKLRSGWTRSCGCLRRESTAQRCLIDLTGQHFGRLVVLAIHPKRYRWRGKIADVFWRSRCECGVECLVSGKVLRSGHTKSCGCLRRE